jgi:hypothetical protein
MNEFYALLIVGVLTSSLLVFGLLSQGNSTTIPSVTRNIKNGKLVYGIELLKNRNQYFDLIVDPSVGSVAKINDAL